VNFHYIAVEGAIAWGRPRLWNASPNAWMPPRCWRSGARTPFLKAFYDAVPGSAFQTELVFLLSRYRQQQELVQRRLFSP